MSVEQNALDLAANLHEQGEWLVVTSYGQKIVTSYDTREEAEAAVEWLRETYPNGPLVEYCHA